MRIWITGAAGFVGRRLSARLRAAGHTVIGVDREVEITDAPRVARSLASARAEAIVHLAAMSSPAHSLRAPEPAARVNYWGTHAVLEAARCAAPDARVLLVTSGEVYGMRAPGGSPFRETDPLEPRTPYARSKACADMIGALYAARGLDVVRVRPFNHTGPGQAPHFAAPAFARQIAAIADGRSEPKIAVGNLQSVRDFLDVDDVVDAYQLLLDRSVPADAYNVASGIGRPIADLLAELIALSGAKCEIEVDPERVRPTDASIGDASRLRATTGWEPRTPWRETLSRLLEHARDA
ncbi:MAG TPA: GDP-mannose 4,6-dehydratase [Myxococcota bacterium]|nr:GDP-mannose 4,6-dehydratase [Myxococcota bacterium]